MSLLSFSTNNSAPFLLIFGDAVIPKLLISQSSYPNIPIFANPFNPHYSPQEFYINQYFWLFYTPQPIILTT